MPATTAFETTSALDLVISHFDQWVSTSDPAFAPTSICYCGCDDTSDDVEQ